MLIGILLVDDFEPWRCFVYSIVQKQPELRILAETSDGMEAVRMAETLKPDVILLDIGLPGLNGIGVSRRIRQIAPASKILFLSQEASTDVVREALGIGVGYVLKADAYKELLRAIDAVVLDRRFLSNGLRREILREAADGPIFTDRIEMRCSIIPRKS